MNISFYVPDGQLIPTTLRLIADEKHVYYWKLHDQFGYDFQLFNVTEGKAVEIVSEIAKIMCRQSYDHGSEWRIVSIQVQLQEERYAAGIIVRVVFRIKDTY